MMSFNKPFLKGASLAVVVFLFSECAWAQRKDNTDAMYRGASTMHGKTAVIPVGFVFEGRIDQTIGSSISRPGQRFEVELSSPVLANGTDVLIPSGSKVIGEVVEAIPSNRMPRQKGFPQPTGKLRVQLSGLRTPDGINYPLVASLAGETDWQGAGRRGGAGRVTQNLGRGVAYVGSQASFEAVAPGMAQRMRGNRSGQPPKVVTKNEMLRDAIYGVDRDAQERNPANVRSLVKRSHNLFILGGSPLSIRVNAPLKIGIAPAAGRAALVDEGIITPESIESTGGRRFARTRKLDRQEEEKQEIEPERPLIPTSNRPKDNSFLPGMPIGGASAGQNGGQGQDGSQGQGQFAPGQTNGQSFAPAQGSYAAPATIPSSAPAAAQPAEEKAPGTDF